LKPRNLSHIRKLNRDTILLTIWHKGLVSRAELARLTRLHKSTVSSVVSELIEEGLVVEIGETRTKVGRRPVALSLNRESPLFLALDIKVRSTFVALYDLGGGRRYIFKVNNGGLLDDPEVYVRKITNEIERSFSQELEEGSVKAVGVSVQGMVDHQTGEVLFAPNIGWRNVPLGRLLKEAFLQQEILVDNDANLALVAEMWRGSLSLKPRSSDLSAVFLSVNEGVGAGIMINGRVYRGATSRAGEFGHTTISQDGAECHCGNRGCLERYSSVERLISNYFGNSAMSGDISSLLSKLKELYLSGDPKATKAINEEIEALSVGISNIINAVDPSIVIVGGFIRVVWDFIQDEVVKRVRRRLTIRPPESVKIVGSSFQGLENLEGAAIMAISTVIPIQT